MQLSDYQDIGQYLKESRESLRVSVEHVAQALHIRAHYIHALENGNLKELPGKAYTRGYIRNYAHFLRLDAEKVLDAYGDVLGPRTQELFIPEASSQQNLPTRWLVWLSFLGLVILYACWYFGVHDRTVARRIISDLPANFAHLLDKNPPVAMDKSWKDCLSGDDAGCYTLLRIQQIRLTELNFYDIDVNNAPPKP